MEKRKIISLALSIILLISISGFALLPATANSTHTLTSPTGATGWWDNITVTVPNGGLTQEMVDGFVSATVNGNSVTVAQLPNGLLFTTGAGTIEQFNNATVIITFEGGSVIPDIEWGDADGDRQITANDITVLRNLIAATDRTLFIQQAGVHVEEADASGDGFINSADVTLLRRYLAGIPGVILGPPGPPPSINRHPGNVRAAIGMNANFSVTAIGYGTLTYSWEISQDSGASWQVIPGADGATHTIPDVQLNMTGWQFRVTVSGRTGVVISETAALTVTEELGQRSFTRADFPDGTRFMALTYDDGPNRRNDGTIGVLDNLDLYEGVYVTFYVQGQAVAGHEDILQRMITSGHDVCNHTWSHQNAHNTSRPDMLNSMRNTARAIFDATGYWPFSFRAPYLHFGTANLSGLDQELNMAFACRIVETNDWRADATARGLADIVLAARNNDAQQGDGSVVLFHDCGGPRQATVDAIPLFVPQMLNEGWRFVTFRQLFEINEVSPRREFGGEYPGPNQRVRNGVAYPRPDWPGTPDPLWPNWPAGPTPGVRR